LHQRTRSTLSIVIDVHGRLRWPDNFKKGVEAFNAQRPPNSSATDKKQSMLRPPIMQAAALINE
jgi:hypothetical protein